MASFRIKLRDFEETVNVPATVKGLENVAEYITGTLAMKFARAVTAAQPVEDYAIRVKQNYDSWHDSHIFAISDLLRDLKTKLGMKRGG